ncbi:P-loop containing nucleoside triphosphate hydrolase protein [Xylariaceae sp. FL1651]|nr:P-loop containing nucleoside triphosphate hydrolase protein [Xylariaceae sp. FL1651]
MPDTEDNNEESNPSLKRNKRLLRVDQIWSRKDRQLHFIKTASAKTKKKRFAKYALVVRRIIDHKGSLNSVEIDIKSRKLANVLINIFKDADGLRLTGDTPVLDIKLFYYAREGLQECLENESAKALPDTELMEDIALALDFIDEECASTTADLNSLLPHGDILYEHLWAIFSPNTILYSSTNALLEPQAFRFSTAKYTANTRDIGGDSVFAVDVKMIHHSGEHVGWAKQTFHIQKFEGSQKIRSFPIYPLKFHPDPDSVRRALIERGHIYLSLTGQPIYREYQGLAVGNSGNGIKARPSHRLVPPAHPGMPGMPGMSGVTLTTGRPPVNTFAEEPRFDSTGRIIIDPVEFSKHNANSQLLEPRFTEKISKEQLTEEDIMLCSHRILGFSFRAKEWGAFAVNQMTKVVWNDTAFDRLVLDEKKRRMISILVKAHSTDTTVFDDIVKGKGKGLIGLLSGSPGVGKTLTAEAVAEMTRRPLYVVSAGELGTDILTTDDRLSTAFEITRRWGCVLLIDEADVFLYKRGVGDLNRNAMVSLFLRRLEYFQGIMVLTTNRDKDIDEAFESRIHFKFKYPPLDAETRLKLWKDFLNHLPAEISVSGLRDEDLQALAKHSLNGREIKNAVSCAASIVRYSKEPLTIALLTDILESLFDDRS